MRATALLRELKVFAVQLMPVKAKAEFHWFVEALERCRPAEAGTPNATCRIATVFLQTPSCLFLKEWLISGGYQDGREVAQVWKPALRAG